MGQSSGPLSRAAYYFLGDDPVAVDATCVKVVGLIPEKIECLACARAPLGHVGKDQIRQLAERIGDTWTPFQVIEAFRNLRRDSTSPIWTSNCFWEVRVASEGRQKYASRYRCAHLE